MKQPLDIFLTINELDDLQQIRSNISRITPQDKTKIIRILKTWTDIQAVANLLMYPSLIPRSQRIEYVIKGLYDTDHPYLILASVVGLGEIELNKIDRQQLQEITDILLALIEADLEVISDRASILVADSLWQLEVIDIGDIVEFLDYSSDVIQHNILITLIRLVGLENIQEYLETCVTKGILSVKGKSIAEEKLSLIKGFDTVSKENVAELDLGLLQFPVLSYIPNLSIDTTTN